jgi:hypothetical protein
VAIRDPLSFSRKVSIMENLYDEFSMSLAASVPRRESLRRIGAVVAGAVLSPWGLATAWAARPDPCKSFCRCSNKLQQNQCLAACHACKGNTSRLAGSCGKYVCCSKAACSGACSDLRSDPNCGACGNNCGAVGETCCGSYCADLASDFDNCGRCGAGCAFPGQYEDGACVDGRCVYWCVEGAIVCNGECTPVVSDPRNCGACGNVCPASAPYCNEGACSATAPCPGGQTMCSGVCYDLYNDSNNCGTSCGNRRACGLFENCTGGVCVPND